MAAFHTPNVHNFSLPPNRYLKQSTYTEKVKDPIKIPDLQKNFKPVTYPIHTVNIHEEAQTDLQI